MMSLQGGAHENHTPNTGRQTPNPQRRPLQRISLNTAVLSPTKRRKQCHAEESTAAVVDLLKPGTFAQDDALPLTPAVSPVKPDRHHTDVPWEEIFSRLCARDLVGNVAPATRLWHEVVHSKELWAILRPHMRLVANNMHAGALLVVISLLQATTALQLTTARRPAAAQFHLAARSLPIMQAEGGSDKPSEVSAEGSDAELPAGDFYDDEKPMVEKPALSNSMRDRLINESRGLGADPNSKNPFLPVFLGVGVFVILGALAVNL